MLKRVGVALGAVAALSGCGGRTAGPSPIERPPLATPPSVEVPAQTADLVARLRQAGAAPRVVAVLALDSYPSVDVPGVVIAIGEERITAFEFATTSEAETVAAGVSPSGHRFGRGQYFWVSDPHFYRTDRVIVLYVGRSRPVLDLLERVLGPQFAGL